MEKRNIIKATYVSGYKIRLFFDNKADKTVDLSVFLKNAQNPMETKYRDKKLFRQFYILTGDLVWGEDEEMIIAGTDLYYLKPGEDIYPYHDSI